MRIKQILAAGITVSLLLGSLTPLLSVKAENTGDSGVDLWKIKRDLNTKKNIANVARQKVVNISDRLKDIQLDLEKTTQEQQDTMARLESTEQQIEVNSKLLAEIEKNLAVKKSVLNKRMRDIYENGHVNYLDVFFGSVDFIDFASRAHLLKRVMNQDISLVNQVNAEQSIVAKKKADLEKDYQLLEELKIDSDTKISLIKMKKNELETLLTSAVEERDTAEKAYQELMATSREIETMIRQNKSEYGAAKGSGSLIWPVSATDITSPFGWRTHPIFGNSRFHSGVDIGASYGDEVIAADSGTVIYSGWMGGYGKAIIIDHGGGISTLYAHNSELAVGEGYHVKKGQLISYVGSTGYSTGPHLHFEVRSNGSPVNPMSYF